MAKIAERLTERFTVVLTDLRGYGDSSKPDGGARHANYSFRAMARDQLEVMRHLGYERFAIASHYRGARTAHRGTIHAICEDYRAAADIDLEMDASDEQAARRIEANVLAQWYATNPED